MLTPYRVCGIKAFGLARSERRFWHIFWHRREALETFLSTICKKNTASIRYPARIFEVEEPVGVAISSSSRHVVESFRI